MGVFDWTVKELQRKKLKLSLYWKVRYQTWAIQIMDWYLKHPGKSEKSYSYDLHRPGYYDFVKEKLCIGILKCHKIYDLPKSFNEKLAAAATNLGENRQRLDN